MPSLIDLTLEGRKVGQYGPWPRVVVDASVWTFAASELPHGRWSLLGLWGEPATVHMAIMDGQTAEIAVVSLDCPDRTFPSVGKHHPPALRLERTINDLFALAAQGSPDVRPWLDHNRWGIRFPLGDRIDALPKAAPYRFLAAEGDGLHQIAVGPVHAGLIEPGHFRFTASGETVVRLEQRLGYVHKGIDGLMTGANLARGVQLAGRTSGDSTVAYAYAFSRAAEVALGLAVPDRAVFLRALLAELERLANHLGDIGAICNDASFALMHAHCGVLRENVLRAAGAAFGHRLMRDIIVPGGVSRDMGHGGGKRSRPRWTVFACAFQRLSNSMTTPLRCRIVPSIRERSSHRSPVNMPPAAMSAAPRAASSMRAGRWPIRPTTACVSTYPFSTRATSMRGSGSGCARSSKACR